MASPTIQRILRSLVFACSCSLPPLTSTALLLGQLIHRLWVLLAFHDASVTNIPNQFNFWNAVPIRGSETYAEIAAQVKLPESIVRRVLKYAISIRIFASAIGQPDSVCHTSLSALPDRNFLYQNWLRHLLEEAGSGSLHVAESLWKFSSGKQEPSQEPAESGFSLANIDKLDKPQTFWGYVNREVEGKPKGWRSVRFAECMQVAASASVIKTDDLLKSAHDWNKLSLLVMQLRRG
ncbi:hypothetical protein H9Q74_006976 [Fusarium xylarioides]|nr:hypothetical protein H9Q71_007040 [Fusarium xylarioides]KAG5822916.1 hypothetical protein H9Q74_006976 [Fusarium xylarioides]